MTATAPTPIRVARPSRDLTASGRFPVEARVQRLPAAGGTRVAARNPYRGEFGVTAVGPGGYRLGLPSHSWGAS